MPREHQDRAFHTLLAHQPAKLAPVRIGQANVEDHKIVDRFLGARHRLSAVARLEDVEIFGHDQLLAQRLAQVLVVIDQQNLLELRHRMPPFAFV